jgi:hypothetical protein
MRYAIQLAVEPGLTSELALFFLGGFRDGFNGFVSVKRLVNTVANGLYGL